MSGLIDGHRAHPVSPGIRAERPDALGKALGAAVAVTAALALLSASFRPAEDGRMSTGRIAISALLLAGHALLYLEGARIRDRWGTYVYVGAQTTLLFIVGLYPNETLLAIGLFAALTAQAIRLLRGRQGAMTVTLASIVVFCASTTISSGVYRGATVALVLAVIGLVSRALAPEHARERPTGDAVPVMASPPRPTGITQRELEVLRMAADGRRSREIAGALGISERTVKAHLAAAYRKLGVETRAAAVARAVEQHLLDSK